MANTNKNSKRETDNRSSPLTTHKLLRVIKDWAFVPLTVLITFILFRGILIIGVVPTTSMEPTVSAGSFFVGNRLADHGGLERSDKILFFFYNEDGQVIYLKRVIGLPGDTVSFRDGDVYINGEKLDESYLPAGVETTSEVETFTVPSRCYFVLGDNREESYDSRWWPYPYVSFDDVCGEGWFFVKIPWWDGEQ